MANEKVLEVLKTLKADPRAKELSKELEKPTSLDGTVTFYAQIAKKLGYEISEEDIREIWKLEEEKKKGKTDKAVADMEALDDDELETVDGGFYYVYEVELRPWYQGGTRYYRVFDCCFDFTDDDCIWEDACDFFNVMYFDCKSSYEFRDPFKSYPSKTKKELGPGFFECKATPF